jgi:3-oxoacyl-(acyl-carrier-protein) synthase
LVASPLYNLQNEYDDGLAQRSSKREDVMEGQLNRVGVVGMGAVTCIGKTAEEFWEGLLEGRCGIDTIQTFDPAGLPSQVAAEIREFDPLSVIPDAKIASRLSRSNLLALAAVDQAVKQANIPGELNEDTGVFIGCNLPGLKALRKAILTEALGRPNRVSPTAAILVMPNTHNGAVSIFYGFKGGGCAPVAACATGVHAIGEAYLHIRTGGMPTAVAGGVESGMERVAFASLGNLRGALSTRYNGDPTKASRPFDLHRNGFVFGEGAGAMMLMSFDEAAKHEIRILAEIIGYGCSFDASDMMNPTGDGAAAAINKTLASANITAGEVDAINTHATATKKGDIAETNAIKIVFGARAYKVPASSAKGHIGHALGASGAVESIAAVQSLLTGIIPQTLNYETLDPDCDLDYVVEGPRQTNPRIILKNSFGFGGANACLVFKRYED